MKTIKSFTAAVLFLTFLPFMTAQAQQHEPLSCVDPTIGGVGVLLQPTRPTTHLPNEMMRFTPDRADMLDDQIKDYPLMMTSHRKNWIFSFLPFADDGKMVWDRRQVYDNEDALPYFWHDDLEGCTFDLAPSRKSAIIRMNFEDGRGLLRFGIRNGNGSYNLKSPTVITGRENFEGMTAYLYAVLDHPATDPQWRNDNKNLCLRVSAPTVMMRYAISYISEEQARANLEREIATFNFDKVYAEAKGVWQKALSQIAVSGGTDKHARIFYTAFYRCFERMVDINEYGRYYSGYDHKVHKQKEPFFVDNWIWDQYIALEPLHTILNPVKETAKINSYIDMYRQSGVLPSFALVWGESLDMMGNFETVWMHDAWQKGLRFDLKTAYEGARANSLERTLLPWRSGPQTSLDKFYNAHGYYPALWPGEKETVKEVDSVWERRQAVSVTTAFSYADWSLAEMARTLGKKDDEKLFRKRAVNYRNVYRPDKKMFWPKDKDGKWIEGVDPRYMDRAYFTENNAYTFQWDVKHDLQGLFDLMGGREKAEQNLDELFRIPLGMSKYNFWRLLPDATGMIGQYAVGNEPGFHIPYIYNYLGAPWKTQKRIHHVIDSYFSDDYFGIPGDEDGGGMSAFVVFSMMGFFPVTPGVPAYAIGSPFFESSTITLPSGKTFTVKAHDFSEGNKYIQRALLNGKELSRSWFSHDELIQGGTLELFMGSKPNKAWAASESALPPSSVE
ncbi:MAG: GH92 family glycosyl hydrolase [Prevotella sp.]|jgi:predicted alpha-1,2-mannosidase